MREMWLDYTSMLTISEKTNYEHSNIRMKIVITDHAKVLYNTGGLTNYRIMKAIQYRNSNVGPEVFCIIDDSL